MVLPPKWISYWRIMELRLRSLLAWRWHWRFSHWCDVCWTCSSLRLYRSYEGSYYSVGRHRRIATVCTRKVRCWACSSPIWQRPKDNNPNSPAMIQICEWMAVRTINIHLYAYSYPIRDWRLIPHRYALNPLGWEFAWPRSPHYQLYASTYAFVFEISRKGLPPCHVNRTL